MAANDVICNFAGYYENWLYPPSPERYGSEHGGYRTNNQEVMFHLFAVQRYDVSFSYKGQQYFFRHDGDEGASVTDAEFNRVIVSYSSANVLLQQYLIDGSPVVKIVDELQDVEIW